MSVKINSLEFENVKKIKAVQLEPAKNGLTVIGGKNRQGKTSVLDAIAWALGGDKYKPSSPQREGSVVEPHLKITLDNGIVVERSGKNSSLKVTDSTGKKGGQQLLNSFVEQFALDLPKFINQSSKEKASTLLKIIGVGDTLYQLEIAKSAYERAKASYEAAANNFKLASLDAENLLDESTAELEKNISDIEELNKKIRANLDREKAEIDAEDYRSQYTYLTEQIEDVRQAKTDLLGSADLPLEGLSVEDGELLYNGHKWDSISGAEQLIVATSIVRKLNPDCGFVLLDKLEQMDTDTLDDFGKWLEAQGLQAIATRVSTGDECSIIIEDGRSMDNDKNDKEENTETKTWKAGAF